MTQSGVSYDPFEPHLQNRKQMFSNDGGSECFKLDLIRIIEDSKELFLVVSNKSSDIIFTRFFDCYMFKLMVIALHMKQSGLSLLLQTVPLVLGGKYLYRSYKGAPSPPILPGFYFTLYKAAPIAAATDKTTPTALGPPKPSA